MDITYKNNKIRRICTIRTIAERKYSQRMADKIFERLEQLRHSDTISTLIFLQLGRCHPLYGNRQGQYAMDLVHPYRLIFCSIGDTIDIVEIQEIVDYH